MIIATLGNNLPYNVNGTPHTINQSVSLTANTSYYINVALTNSQPGGGGSSQTLFQVQGDISGGNFIKDDCCKKDVQGVCRCRKGKNLIINGDFSIASNFGFTSTYQYNTNNVIPNLVMPGQYKVVNKNDALIISPNWKVQDVNSTFGNFLVVNGKTTQPLNTNSVIWQQTVTGLEKDSTYKFCMSLKHLPQSTFDLKPQVAFDIGPWMIVNTNSSIATDWMQYTITFVATQTSMTLKIRLKEDIPGDGNDIAIDDIGLTKISKFPLGPYDISHSQANGVLTASYKLLNASDDILPSGCRGVWTIGKPVISGSGNPQTLNDLLPKQTNVAWPLTTTFPGYNGYPLTPGAYYGLILSITGCDCFADNMKGVLITTPNALQTTGTMSDVIISKKLKEQIFKEVTKPQN